MSTEREIGMHAEAIDTLKQDVAEIKRDMADIKLLLASARGGWKTMMWVAGFASAAGAALWKAYELVKGFVHDP